jgi:hypothetical protein
MTMQQKRATFVWLVKRFAFDDATSYCSLHCIQLKRLEFLTQRFRMHCTKIRGPIAIKLTQTHTHTHTHRACALLISDDRSHFYSEGTKFESRTRNMKFSTPDFRSYRQIS